MTFSCPHLAHHLEQQTIHHHDHHQPNTMPGGLSVTVRLRVTVPTYTKLPDRVRLVVKERGALFFPYRRKIASVYFDSWTRLPNNVWQGSLVQQVPMNVPKLLKKTQRTPLSLQLYCLHRRTVQHKAIGNLERLLHQGRYEELQLEMRYLGCPLQVQTTAATPEKNAEETPNNHAEEVLNSNTEEAPNNVEEEVSDNVEEVAYYDAEEAPNNVEEEGYYDAEEAPNNVEEVACYPAQEAPNNVEEVACYHAQESPSNVEEEAYYNAEEVPDYHVEEVVDHHVDVGSGDEEAFGHHVDVGSGDEEAFGHHVDEGGDYLGLVCIGASFLATMGLLLYAAVAAVANEAPQMEMGDWVANVVLTAAFFALYLTFRRRRL